MKSDVVVSGNVCITSKRYVKGVVEITPNLKQEFWKHK